MYLPTLTININQMQANTPYKDRMDKTNPVKSKFVKFGDLLRRVSIRFLLRGFAHLIFTVFLEIYSPWPDEDASPVRDVRCWK